jgi:glycosyltransferase involved in cell wall biosynthesis
MSEHASFQVCTTVTRAQLPGARVLCDSVRRHHPEVGITVLVVDDVDGSAQGPSGARVVSPAAIGVPADVHARLALACNGADLAEALAPWLVRALVAEGAPAVVAFGPETEVFAPFSDVVELAREHGIVLTPRADRPYPDDDLEPTPAQLAQAGPFASEFVAVGSTATSFLEWWRDRQEQAALDPGGAARWGPWAVVVPALFPFHLLLDPGCGTSLWNLHEREVRATSDGFEVSGRPLRWFSFEGFSPDAPYVLSTKVARPRALLSQQPALARLCDEHAARLRDAGSEAQPPAYGYANLPDGKMIDTRMRQLYLDALREARERGDPEPPSPFGSGGADAFVDWVDEPVEPPTEPVVSRYLTRVWRESKSLQEMFVTLAGEGGEQYLGWIRHDEGLPSWLLPSEDDVLELMLRRQRTRPSGPRPHGVNLVGYVTAVFGVGEVARLISSTLDTMRVPAAVVANRATLSRQSLAFDTRPPSDAPYDLNMFCINADNTTDLAQQLGSEFFAGRTSIGLWFWEAEDFPPSMTEAFELVDEVWVASDFVLEAVAAQAPKPVRKFPLPVVVPSVPEGVTRSELGLPEDRFVFLFVYDYLSTAERKNPVGLIDAYRRAFGPDDGTALVLKSINGEKRTAQYERVRLAAAGRPDVIVRDAYLPSEQSNALLGHCDAYVSLHRSEGFGMDMAKAMGLGKPVIATRYSGNLEYMDDGTAYLVDYDLEPVGPGCEPYPPDSRWARPRTEHAAELMRRVVERPDEARERGRCAAARINTDFSIDARAPALVQMLREARARGSRATWRRYFMDGWRERRRRGGGLPPGTVDWLPDGVPVDGTMRTLLRTRADDVPDHVPDPEVDLDGFYACLNERVFPPQSPVVSRYLYRLWCDRPDLQSHFPDLEADPRTYLAFLVDRGHDDTDLPHQLLPSDEDVRRAARYQMWRLRRQKLGRVVRTAGQRAAGLVNRR